MYTASASGFFASSNHPKCGHLSWVYAGVCLSPAAQKGAVHGWGHRHNIGCDRSFSHNAHAALSSLCQQQPALKNIGDWAGSYFVAESLLRIDLNAARLEKFKKINRGR